MRIHVVLCTGLIVLGLVRTWLSVGRTRPRPFNRRLHRVLSRLLRDSPTQDELTGDWGGAANPMEGQGGHLPVLPRITAQIPNPKPQIPNSRHGHLDADREKSNSSESLCLCGSCLLLRFRIWALEFGFWDFPSDPIRITRVLRSRTCRASIRATPICASDTSPSRSGRSPDDDSAACPLQSVGRPVCHVKMHAGRTNQTTKHAVRNAVVVRLG